MEIVAAFQRKIRVIPVLVDRSTDAGEARSSRSTGTALPTERHRTAASTRFHADVNRLIEAIKRSFAVVEKGAELSATPAAPPPAPAAVRPPEPESKDLPEPEKTLKSLVPRAGAELFPARSWRGFVALFTYSRFGLVR